MAKKNREYVYQIYNQHGELLCEATEGVRYSKDTELVMLENGYTIKLNGRKLTKKEIKDGKK